MTSQLPILCDFRQRVSVIFVMFLILVSFSSFSMPSLRSTMLSILSEDDTTLPTLPPLAVPTAVSDGSQPTQVDTSATPNHTSHSRSGTNVAAKQDQLGDAVIAPPADADATVSTLSDTATNVSNKETEKSIS